MQDKIILKKNARQRLELTNTDLKLLAFLEQQRLLTLQQFYQAAKHLFELGIKEYSFKNRIRKFEDYHLIRSEHYSKGFEEERFKFLAIGSKAVDVLIESGLLDESYNKPKIYKFNQKKNLLHFIATQQAALNILTTFNKKAIKDPNTNTFHAEIAKYMTTGSKAGNKLNGATMTIVKPDWIIKLKGTPEVRDAIINIEMDMGTEPIETLAQKLFKYAILAEKNPEVLHIMDIVIVDNSLSNRSSFSDGIGRTKNILQRFKSDSAVIKRLKESGLKLIVHPLGLNVNQLYKTLRKY